VTIGCDAAVAARTWVIWHLAAAKMAPRMLANSLCSGHSFTLVASPHLMLLKIEALMTDEPKTMRDSQT